MFMYPSTFRNQVTIWTCSPQFKVNGYRLRKEKDVFFLSPNFGSPSLPNYYYSERKGGREGVRERKRGEKGRKMKEKRMRRRRRREGSQGIKKEKKFFCLTSFCNSPLIINFKIP